MVETKQINFRVEPKFGQAARAIIDRLRRGGPAFREALVALLEDHDAAIYLPASVIYARLNELDARNLSAGGARRDGCNNQIRIRGLAVRPGV